MVHRICMESPIDESYYSRNLVISKDRLFEVIETLLDKGVTPGSIEETIHDNKKFHLTFDDGYSEHLKIAKILKKNFSLAKEHCTFCINVGNSLHGNYSGMDLIYNTIKRDGIDGVVSYAVNKDWNVDPNIKSIKNKYISLPPDEIKNFKNHFNFDVSKLESIFLDRNQIKNLSVLFNVASHGITHRDLRYHMDISEREILKSKKELEDLIESKVSIMCYPEGKNNKMIRKITKESGYEYGLSINNIVDDPFCIGRYCINRHLGRFLEEIR